MRRDAEGSSSPEVNNKPKSPERQIPVPKTGRNFGYAEKNKYSTIDKDGNINEDVVLQEYFSKFMKEFNKEQSSDASVAINLRVHQRNLNFFSFVYLI